MYDYERWRGDGWDGKGGVPPFFKSLLAPLIVIENKKFLKRNFKDKRKAPAYSRALRIRLCKQILSTLHLSFRRQSLTATSIIMEFTHKLTRVTQSMAES